MAREHIRFSFDPLCPWCYQTSRWARQLVRLGAADVSWGLYSLELADPSSAERARGGDARGALALSTAWLCRARHGNEAIGAFYASLGAAVHEQGQPVQRTDIIVRALTDAGLDPSLADEARSNSEAWAGVCAEHDDLVTRHDAIGVPAIALDGGDGPAMFGPVLREVPEDADAVALLDHVAWLLRYENFSELKRNRKDPDLESMRKFRARQAG